MEKKNEGYNFFATNYMVFLLTFGYEFIFMIKLGVYIHQYDNCAKK
ncbi:hypothetical protein XBKB1_3950011 [Xenorhabdus bovienii str. kraussei Becker Underwood]|uniref:Uncharacterized protein n=1 Tax=Xenorhabdus bovienii str. kraussei Becker Underwood TaxID=1398204 RepID=A0A077PX76_XENBV|nr:hypothetical protein XBKB1_3950011 [Xenorhabdus bovienii str. kraussei Becker Underwood]